MLAACGAAGGAGALLSGGIGERMKWGALRGCVGGQCGRRCARNLGIWIACVALGRGRVSVQRALCLFVVPPQAASLRARSPVWPVQAHRQIGPRLS